MAAPFGAVLSGLLALAPAQAQVIIDDESGPAGSLVNLPGMNTAQNQMAVSIDRVCPTLVANAAVLTPTQLDLRDVCRRMVQTANDALDLPGRDTEFSYVLSEDETRNVLQRINGEELQSAQPHVVEIGGVQVSNIGARLADLRAGLAGPGLSVAGLSLQAGDHEFAFHDPEHYQIVPAQWTENGWLSRLGLFATGSATFGDKDATGELDGFDFDTLGVTIGGDYRLTDRLIMGVAFGYASFDADFDTTARSPAGQNLEADTFTGSVFATYQFEAGPFVDTIASVGRSNYDSTRRIVIVPDPDSGQPPEDRTARGDFKAWHYGIAANAGYDIAFAGFTITPLARIEFIRADIDGFTETGANGLNLRFGDQDANSLTTNLGVEATYALSTPFGVLLPGVRAEYIHEFLNDDDGPRVIYAADTTASALSAFTMSTEPVDRDYGIVGASLAATFPAGWAAFADYSTVVGLRDFTIHSINFGVRKSF